MKKTTFLFIALLISAFSWQAVAQNYCEPESTSAWNSDYVSMVSSESALMNINYTADSYITDYIDETGLTLTVYPGQQFILNTAYIGGTQTMGVWVDWNQDGNFGGENNQDEQIALSNGVSPQSFNASVPADINNGEYRLRVRGAYDFYGDIVSDGDDFSCNDQTYGTTVDFTLNVVDPPTCPAPTDLLATNITTDSADLSWTAGGDETVWEVLYGEAGFDPETEGTTLTVSVDPETTISDLDVNTNYAFYVTSICGTNDESLIAGPMNFKTACGTVSSLPFTENFDSYPTGPEGFPDCWERVTYTSGANVWPSIVSQNATSGANTLKFQSAIDDPTYAITPAFEEDITNLRVSFSLQREGISSGTIDVGVMSDANDTNTFELVQTIDPGHNNHQEYTINLNQVSLSGANNHIALRHNSNSSVWYYWLDDFEIGLVPSCIEPSNLTTSNITADSADLSWTAGGDETVWEVLYGEAGFDPESEGTTVAVNNDPETTISDLETNTAYEFYVTAICGTTDESSMTGPMSFRTACGTISSLPYSEDFDTYGTGPDAFPNCWERVTYVSGTNVWPSIVSRSDAPSAPNALRFQSLVDTPTYAISPQFGEDINNLRVTFKLKREGTSSGTIDVGVMSDVSDTNTFELVQTIDPDDNNFHEYVFDLNQVSLSGPDNYIALRHNSNSNIYYYWLDDFEVELSPSCVEPTALTATNITSTSASLSWTAGGDETEWQVLYGEAGFDVETEGTTVTVNDDAETILTDLDHSTMYDVYVRAMCSEDDVSAWVGPETFATLCSTTVAPWSEDFEGGTAGNILIDDFSCWSQEYESGTNDWKLVSQNGNSSVEPRSGSLMAEFRNTSTGSATKLVSPVLNMSELTTPKLTFYFANVNWLGDIDQLRVYYKASASDTEWTLIPDAVYIEEHTEWEEVELILPEANGATGYVIAFEATSDYARGLNLDAISISDASATDCDSPLGITVNYVTEDEAEITWSPANEGDDQWEISLATGGQSADQGLIAVVNDTPSLIATGLEADTEYSVYLRTICSDEVSSDWAFNGTFTTLEGTQEPECDAVTDVEVTDITADTAVVSWTGTDTAVNGYTVGVFEAGADQEEDTPVFVQTVTADVTTVTVTDLEHLTSYDVYIASQCGTEIPAFSDVVTFTTEDIASVGDFSFANLEIFPNPASTNLNISAAKVIEEIQVYNILGQLVMTQKFNDAEVSLDVSNLTVATYLLKVKVDGVIGTVRFVKK